MSLPPHLATSLPTMASKNVGRSQIYLRAFHPDQHYNHDEHELTVGFPPLHSGTTFPLDSHSIRSTKMDWHLAVI